MNKCLNCGKEIPEGRKFCSRSCSASYNNVRKKRKPWTEEQREAVRIQKVEQVCKYCGSVTGKYVHSKKKLGVCLDCKPYRKINLYERLGIQEGPLKYRYQEALKILSTLYFEDRCSLPEIEKQTGVNTSLLRKLLVGEGKELRTRSESQRERLFQGKAEILIGNPKYKHGWYETWEGKKIFYRSSYELEYAIQLDEQRIKYSVEDLRIPYFDTQKGEERVAIPDFHLLDTNELVEVKSSWTYNEQLMKDKFKAYREAGYIPKLFLDKKFKEI